MRQIYVTSAELSAAHQGASRAPVSDTVELLRDYLSLTDTALRLESEHTRGLYIAESLKILEGALSLGHQPRSLLTTSRWLPALEALEQRYPQLSALPTLIASASALESLVGYRVHRGMLASMLRPPLTSVRELCQSGRLLVILEDLKDHTNIGAICRSVVGLGAGGIILSPRCADPLYRRSLRVSMGAALRCSWARSEGWPALSEALKSEGYTLIALSLREGAQALERLASEPPAQIALLLGSEGEGLSEEALSYADHQAYIEMCGGVESLNVASAAAVAMWALTRAQRAQAAQPQ